MDAAPRAYSRSNERAVEFGNVTYENEGLWACTATNTIKGGRIKKFFFLFSGYTRRSLGSLLSPRTFVDRANDFSHNNWILAILGIDEICFDIF